MSPAHVAVQPAVSAPPTGAPAAAAAIPAAAAAGECRRFLHLSTRLLLPCLRLAGAGEGPGAAAAQKLVASDSRQGHLHSNTQETAQLELSLQLAVVALAATLHFLRSGCNFVSNSWKRE